VVFCALWTEHHGLNSMFVSCTAEMETILLTPDDLLKLKLLLQPVAAFWKKIADGIGMKESVPTIEYTPGNKTPADFLRDLLIRWLDKGPHRLEVLCQALKQDDDIQGRMKVVRELEQFRK